MLKIRRQQGLGFELLLRVSNQHPANGHRRLTSMVPNGGIRRDFNLTGAFPISARSEKIVRKASGR
jgi:hypothetical protein